MNINEFLTTISVPHESSIEAWTEMVAMRRTTFRAFATIEQDKGFVRPHISLSTSHGQEVLRILFFRVLEEAAESLMAIDLPHRKEEMIDCFNYLISAPLLDENILPESALVELLHEQAELAFVKFPSPRPRIMTWNDMADFTYSICGELADTFRNRAWMNNTQDLYFSGDEALKRTLCLVSNRAFRVFPSWDDFARYYYAKDLVLQFRLITQY